MRFRCSFCEEVFESTKPPNECPLCQGRGRARFPNRMPAKRMTHKQRRAIARSLAETKAPEPQPGMVFGECTIKL